MANWNRKVVFDAVRFWSGWPLKPGTWLVIAGQHRNRTFEIVSKDGKPVDCFWHDDPDSEFILYNATVKYAPEKNPNAQDKGNGKQKRRKP